MSGELEAAGALATAGLAAGAIEGREAQGAGDGACINCGATLAGAYCSQCGQAAHPHRSLVHMVEEFLHGILHFDTKAWRTLPMLAFRPGTLTRNYVYGKRARYISPLALFLFTVFFMFAVFAFAGGPPVNVVENTTVEEATADLAEAQTSLTETQQALAEVQASTEAAPGTPQLAIDLAQQAVTRSQGQVASRQRALERAQARARGDATVGGVAADQPEESWQDIASGLAERENFTIVPGWDAFNHKIQEKLRNPDLAAYKIQQAAYKFSFLLIPISLPFIALLFLWKRGITLYDHVVFALYALAFVSIVFVTVVLATRVDWLSWVPPLLISVGIPVHTFFHLKGAYALSWFSALWRTFFMMIFAALALLIFLAAIVILGLTG